MRALRDAVGLTAQVTDARVSVTLVEGGVMCAVIGHPAVTKLAERGIEVTVDEFSLRQWGYSPTDITGFSTVGIEYVVDRMLDATTKVVWH